MKLHLSIGAYHVATFFNVRIGLLLLLLIGNSSSFFLKWPWPYVYPGTTATTAVGATINYGYFRPAIVVQVPATTAATTTTTTTTARPTTSVNQLFINALLGSSLPVNNSLLLSLANALSNRPVIGGLAQPYPSLVGGVATTGTVSGVAGFPQTPQIIGGVASPIGGIAAGGAGGIILPSGFPASGGVASAGIIPGLFPGIIGRSAGKGNSTPSSTGKIVFASKK